jgi:hypothetical protein
MPTKSLLLPAGRTSETLFFSHNLGLAQLIVARENL